MIQVGDVYVVLRRVKVMVACPLTTPTSALPVVEDVVHGSSEPLLKSLFTNTCVGCGTIGFVPVAVPKMDHCTLSRAMLASLSPSQ